MIVTRLRLTPGQSASTCTIPMIAACRTEISSSAVPIVAFCRRRSMRKRMTTPPTIQATAIGTGFEEVLVDRLVEEEADDAERQERDEECDEQAPAGLAAADETAQDLGDAVAGRGGARPGWRRTG